MNVFFALKGSKLLLLFPGWLQGGGSDVVSVACFGVRVSVMFHLMFVNYILLVRFGLPG